MNVGYPCLSPLVSCERQGKGDGLMKNYPPQLLGAPRGEEREKLKLHPKYVISQWTEFYRRNGASSKLQGHPDRNSGALPFLEVENSKGGGVG